MKNVLKVVLSLVVMFGFAQAAMFQSVVPEKAELLQSGKGKLYCPNCGMNLVKFYKTSHAMKQKDGSIHQYCSIHCLAEANDEITPDTKVVDVNTLKFIDAFTATYVVGSSKKGTMTMNSKYAFTTKAEAEAFAKANGGKVMGFAEAVQLAADDIAKDNKMVEKKRAMAAGKGEKMFGKMCKQDKLPSFTTIAEAKTYVVDSGICGQLKDKQYQAIAIYLARKDGMTHKHSATVEVPKDAKCPVCGMFVAKYPKWAAEIQIDGYTHYFDGVKDMMKFYLEPAAFHKQAKQSMITKILVSDYYTLKAIDANSAWYVIGSNVYGPMGNELIPFSNKKDALAFNRDHFGKQVIPFDQITQAMIRALDE
ncbi:MAG: nitrous oxide reductase accessory protein NosL [Campylobacterota bacterium]|nr:nitrous oxide reductase accessory protein NosL [Campylobacterota bacterium]